VVNVRTGAFIFYHEEGAEKMTNPTLEERVAYLEENVRALNKATTDTAAAMQALLDANQTRSAALSTTLDAVLEDICPFPPGCE